MDDLDRCGPHRDPLCDCDAYDAEGVISRPDDGPSLYCRHGVFVGYPGGADLMCGACEGL